MNKHSSQLLRLTRRRAGFTLHQLLDEIQLLTVAFPDVRDAFDADELPIAFILKRDAHRSTGKRMKDREHLPAPSKQPLDD